MLVIPLNPETKQTWTLIHVWAKKYPFWLCTANTVPRPESLSNPDPAFGRWYRLTYQRWTLWAFTESALRNRFRMKYGGDVWRDFQAPRDDAGDQPALIE